MSRPMPPPAGGAVPFVRGRGRYSFQCKIEVPDMARFTAPADTSGITLSSGFHPVRSGIVEVPDDLPAGDRLGLAANGFTLAPAVPEAKGKKAAAAPASDAE